MLDKILTNEKTFRIFCLILIAILFFIVLRKNKKEKFTWSAPDTENKFKIQVETALGDNLTAIKNLGEFAKQITDTTSGKLDLKDVNLEVNDIKINGKITNTDFADIKTTVNNHKTTKQDSDANIKLTENNYKDVITRLYCPDGYTFDRYSDEYNTHWCYKNAEVKFQPCNVTTGRTLPKGYSYGNNESAPTCESLIGK